MNESGFRILVVDDEPSIRRLLRISLSSQGHTVFEAATAASAFSEVTLHSPDLMLLDLSLPDLDGIHVVRRIREWTHLPIIILSVRDNESDKVAVLDAGADDYLTKPFAVAELMARIRAAVRHSGKSSTAAVFSTGELLVDVNRRLVKVGDNQIHLTPREFDLLQTLVMNAGRVITHRSLLQQVWGKTHETKMHMLRVHMSNLRGKIEPDITHPRYILNEPGVGYRLQIEE